MTTRHGGEGRGAREQGNFAPSDGAKPTPRCMAAGLVSRSASKVNVEIADPTYLPADAAFENLEEARDNLLLVVAAEHALLFSRKDVFSTV